MAGVRCVDANWGRENPIAAEGREPFPQRERRERERGRESGTLGSCKNNTSSGPLTRK